MYTFPINIQARHFQNWINLSTNVYFVFERQSCYVLGYVYKYLSKTLIGDIYLKNITSV